MILSAFTVFHVILSLIAIGSGLFVLNGLLHAKQLDRWTRTFLIFTAATSATGFLFPFHGFTPAIGVGIVSLVILVAAILALYRYGLAGGWRRTYVITSMIALYLNVFVLIVQLFQKVPALKALAPTQSEWPFQAAQLTTLLIFTGLTVQAVRKFRPAPRSMTARA